MKHPLDQIRPLDQVRLDAFDRASRLMQTLRTEQNPTEQALQREPFNPGQLRSFQTTLREMLIAIDDVFAAVQAASAPAAAPPPALTNAMSTWLEERCEHLGPPHMSFMRDVLKDFRNHTGQSIDRVEFQDLLYAAGVLFTGRENNSAVWLSLRQDGSYTAKAS